MTTILKRSNFSFFSMLILFVGLGSAQAQKVNTWVHNYQVPVLKGKEYTTVVKLAVNVDGYSKPPFLEELIIDFAGSTRLSDIKAVKVFASKDSLYPSLEKAASQALFAIHHKEIKKQELKLKGKLRLPNATNYIWLAISLHDKSKPDSRISATIKGMTIETKSFAIVSKAVKNRIGIAVRQQMQDNVHTSRIPGIAKANNGDLIALYDARYASARDLQGDMDIAINRSQDGGNTWLPMEVVLDKGSWGNLPEKFNGVSDACILVDKFSGTIFIAGLWMYGVLDSTGKWIEGLNENSANWNHQWRAGGSQPGLDVKQTSQFLITQSSDNGKTWSEPINLTTACKRPEWWLWAPAPGSGITLADGTLVFPTQGRDHTGKPFSNITYSKDNGKTWQVSEPALDESTTECAVAELSDGSIMLNMRTNANRNLKGPGNGRSVAITKDLGKTWTEHHTSRKALPEPVCMASLYRHDYVEKGKKKSILLFLNPASTTHRNNITLKVSDDDGNTWQEERYILLDELSGRGYSSITSVNNDTIGVLYESSQAQLVFQQIKIKELIK